MLCKGTRRRDLDKHSDYAGILSESVIPPNIDGVRTVNSVNANSVGLKKSHQKNFLAKGYLRINSE